MHGRNILYDNYNIVQRLERTRHATEYLHLAAFRTYLTDATE